MRTNTPRPIEIVRIFGVVGRGRSAQRVMEPRETERLVQRLVQNPHDPEAITTAHAAGSADPKGYALLLEKVGTATSDAAFACHWLTEAANVWSTTLGDTHRAARALMIAVDRDPTQPTPAERLADLYRENGDTKALVALFERRAKALTAVAQQDLSLRPQVSAIHEELGQVWAAPPLSQPKKAIEAYKRAIEFDESSQFSIYSARELLKAEGSFQEAIPYFEFEQRLVSDRDRQIALYQDEGDVRQKAGDLAGASTVLRRARTLDASDPALKQQLATVALERVQARRPISPTEVAEGASLFVELSEAHPGKHGMSYALCALELVPGHDVALRLALDAAKQLGRSSEIFLAAERYLKSKPNGQLATDARALVLKELEEQAKESERQARRTEAAHAYREILALEPTHSDALAFLESYLRQRRQFSDLRDVLRQAAQSERAPRHRRVAWLSASAHLCEVQLRDIDGAIDALKQLVVLEPTRRDLKQSLERLLARTQANDVQPPNPDAPPNGRAVHVFISYSQDSDEHQEQVRTLAARLNDGGFDVHWDQSIGVPARGWQSWSRDQMQKADFVLVVCTARYRSKFEGDEPGGANWEGALIEKMLYDDDSRNEKFIPVLFHGGTRDHIPLVLTGTTWYELPSQYARLLPRIASGSSAERVSVDQLRKTNMPLATEDVQLRRLREELQVREKEGADASDIADRILIRRRQIRDSDDVGQGSRLARGRYELADVINSGGFGTVWRTWDHDEKGWVAVKILHRQHIHDRSRIERFFRGARLMAALHHPGIVRVLLEHAQEGTSHYFVMEYIRGGDLAQAVKRGTFSKTEAVQGLIDIGEALAFAHAKGVIHRDVKPGNVLLGANRELKLTDFDLVHAVDTTGGTRTGAMGTAIYAAPELTIDAKRADSRADIFSLGILGLFILYGRDLPMQAWFAQASILDQLELPPGLRPIIERACNHDLALRFGSIEEMLDALRGLERQRGK